MSKENGLSDLKSFLEQKYPGHNFSWRESGPRVMGLCPEHSDDHPSFNIFRYNDKAYFKCFSCGFHGSLYDFIKDKLTPEQIELNTRRKETQDKVWSAFKLMKDHLFEETVGSSFATDYLTKRYADLKLVKSTETGFIKKGFDYGIDELVSGGKKLEEYGGWLVFAHTDIKGNICRLKFRRPDSKDIRTANINGFEKESAAFGLKRLGEHLSANHIDKYPIKMPIYITEGEFNKLTYMSVEHKSNIVSVGGKDYLTPELISVIEDADFLPVIALDQDGAGYKHLKKLYSSIKNKENVIYCEYGKKDETGNLIEKDFDDILKNKTEDGITEEFKKIKYKRLKDFKDVLEEERFKEEIETEKFIDKTIINLELKNLYLDKHNISPTLSQRLYEIPSDIRTNITDELVFGVKIQYPAMFIIAGPTSAGKTEFALEIADHVAMQKDHISMFYQYEGNEIDLQIRAFNKGINNPNFYFKVTPTLDVIKKDIIRFKDKKMFILIDYYQLFARFLQTKDRGKNDSIRPYISEIFFFFTELIKKYKNICVCLLSSLSNQALKELPGGEKAAEINNITVLSGLKEDGDIGYNMDYGYAMFFCDLDEALKNKYSISRKKYEYKDRSFTVLKSIKHARIGISNNNSFYKFNKESRRYEYQKDFIDKEIDKVNGKIFNNKADEIFD